MRQAAAINRGRLLDQTGAQRRFWWRAAEPNAPTRNASAAEMRTAAATASRTAATEAIPAGSSRPIPDGKDRPRFSRGSRAGGNAGPRSNGRQNARPTQAPVRGFGVLVIAGLFGGLLFAGAGGFGASVRMVEPLPLQLDHALVAAGLGINEVALTGHRYTSDADIYEVLALEKAGSIFRYDVTAARQRIETLPWVRTAHIARVLPDRLTISIEERRAVAIWEHNSRVMLVDQSGRVLANLAGGYTAQLALTRIAGTGAPRALARLLATLRPHTEFAPRLEIARRMGDRRWTLELAGGTIVHLPADREGEALLRLSRHNERSGLLEKGPQVIDLRLDGIIAVRANPAIAPAAGVTAGIRSLL